MAHRNEALLNCGEDILSEHRMDSNVAVHELGYVEI
jgi:hypothetical protein